MKDQLNGEYGAVPAVIGDENYGEGSSREHAALEPRHLGEPLLSKESETDDCFDHLQQHSVLPVLLRKMDLYCVMVLKLVLAPRSHYSTQQPALHALFVV